MSSDVVALVGVTKRYGSRLALADVTFALKPGEAVGYLGPNGAGKTTTLKLLCGLLRPDAGRIALLGRDPAGHGGAALARVGALVETPGIAPYLHGRDLLEYVAEVKGVPLAGRPAEVRRTATAMGIPDQLDRAVGGLSTGQQRRLLIAGALIGAPDLLLLDEPTLGLDPVARRDLREILGRLRTGGTTLLLSTHLLDDVEEVCDRVLFLRDGRLVGDEPTHPTGTPGAIRQVRLRFLAPVPWDRLTPLLGPGETLTEAEDREVTWVHQGGDERQAAVLAAMHWAQLPLVSARTMDGGLTERYLAAVGREDDG